MNDTLNDSMDKLAKTALGVKAERDRFERENAELRKALEATVKVLENSDDWRSRHGTELLNARALLAKHGKA